VITFCETITSINGQYIDSKGTKTVSTRTFPISPYLKEILEQIRPTQVNPDDFVFAEPNGKHFDTNKFYRAWHTSGASKTPGIVSHLAQIPWEEGGINGYRPPYNTRHTYITLTLEQMARDNKLTPSNIALLADSLGTGVDTINKHYLGRSQDWSVLYNPTGQRKMSAASLAQKAQPEDQVANSQSVASLSSLEEPKDQALQQENDELPSALQFSPPSAPVEDLLEPSSLPEADLAEMASLLTLGDEEFQQPQDE
jgi:hypothetical protein